MSALLLEELYLEDPKEFRLCFQLTPQKSESLLEMISPLIQKCNTVLRDAIPARLKLEITLNFLATWNSYRRSSRRKVIRRGRGKERRVSVMVLMSHFELRVDPVAQSVLRGGRSGIESRWARDFPPVQTDPGAHPASYKMCTGSFPGVKCGRGVLLTTHPLLVPRSWKSRAIPLPTL